MKFHKKCTQNQKLLTCVDVHSSAKIHEETLISFYFSSKDVHKQISAAGLPWLEHFRVQCYTWVKSLLVGFRRTKFTTA